VGNYEENRQSAAPYADMPCSVPIRHDDSSSLFNQSINQQTNQLTNHRRLKEQGSGALQAPPPALLSRWIRLVAAPAVV